MDVCRQRRCPVVTTTSRICHTSFSQCVTSTRWFIKCDYHFLINRTLWHLGAVTYRCRFYFLFLLISYRLIGLHASSVKGQWHWGIFFLVKGTIWGNCKSLLVHFKGTKARTKVPIRCLRVSTRPVAYACWQQSSKSWFYKPRVVDHVIICVEPRLLHKKKPELKSLTNFGSDWSRNLITLCFFFTRNLFRSDTVLGHVNS